MATRNLERAAYTIGFWIRETGQAMDRIGSRLHGNNYFKEQRMYQNQIPNSDYLTFITSTSFQFDY